MQKQALWENKMIITEDRNVTQWKQKIDSNKQVYVWR
jgi:hypothetical protein